jgi:UDP-glucose 4-epimerase
VSLHVLVTGGAGYIGSVVSHALVASGHHVVVYDSLVKGHAHAVPAGAAFVAADLADDAALRACIKTHHVDAVVHMAADSLVGESVPHPAKYYRNNLLTGIAMLDSLRCAGVSACVFSSSAAVYGNAAKQPIDEDDPVVPTNPYGETKLAFERALHWYGRAYGLRHVSLRYFNAAGAVGDLGERHHPETHLIPLVLEVALGHSSCISMFGDDYPTRDGSCIRDYVHVSDIARAHVLALEALAAPPADLPSIFNIGCGGHGHTVREVIDTSRRVTGKPIPIDVRPRRQGDPAVLVANPSRIQSTLGWRAEQPGLETIIESAWRWMSSR